MSPIPYRVTFLPPTTTLPAGWERVEPMLSYLVLNAIFEHVIRHPRVAMTDPDDVVLTDHTGAICGSRHPRFEGIKGFELGKNRRDEVLWLDLRFVAPGQTAVVLRAERHGEPAVEFPAPAGVLLSDGIAIAIDAWGRARGLGPAPRAFVRFSDGDLLMVAQEATNLAHHAETAPEGAPPLQVPMPPVLTVPFLRLVSSLLGMYVHDRVLRVEPDSPWALRDDHLARWHDGGAPRAELRRVFALAPNWGKPYGVMWGDDVEADEHLYCASTNTALCPTNPFALVNHGGALWEVGERAAAHRMFERATRLAPTLVDAHRRALDVRRDLGGVPGEILVEAKARVEFIEGLVRDGRSMDSATDVAIARLALSNALFDVGRLPEAIQVREGALARVENREAWPKMHAVLNEWRSDPTIFAHACAREGYHRGDYGRAVVGTAKGPIDADFDQLAAFVESLVHLDKPRTALLAFATYSRRSPGSNTFGSLAGAFAMLVNGLFEPAMDLVLSARLRAPELPTGTRITRLLRLAATHPLESWTAQIAALESKGARTVARLLARDAADFAPGAANDPVVRRALATPKHDAPLQPSLAGLRDAFARHGTAAIDGLLEELDRGSTLADADQAVASFADVVPRPAPNAPEDASKKYEARLLYAAAACLVRYLGTPPETLGLRGGALRSIATEALAALAGIGASTSDADVRAVLVALEPFGGLDSWLVDPWLLAVERALDLEASCGGRLGKLIAGLPHMTSFIRGDERIAAEARALVDAKRAGKDALVVAMAKRMVRASGGNHAVAWAEAAPRALPRESAVDACFVAYYAHPCHAGPAVELALLLMPTRPDVAFDVLAERLGWAGDEWKATHLPRLRAVWSPQLALPFDLEPARRHASDLMRAGRDLDALRALRWCDALEAGHEETLRALGGLYAKLGDLFRSTACLSEIDASTGPLEAARRLRDAGHARQAQRAFELVALSASDPRLVAECAAAAPRAEDPSPAGRAFAALAASDIAAARNVVARGGDARAERALLVALEARAEDESQILVRPACLERARHVLTTTRGTTDVDATLARLHALRLREQALFGIDRKALLGKAVSIAELEQGFRDRARAVVDRGGAIVAALGSGAPPAGATDPEVFPGMALARLSQYVMVVRGMQSGDLQGTLARAGLDMMTYAQMAGLWGQRLASDPALHAAFTRMLMAPAA